MTDNHAKIMKKFCRICLNTNKLTKTTTLESYYFCLANPKFRICKWCKERAANDVENGRQFSDELKNYGINGKKF